MSWSRTQPVLAVGQQGEPHLAMLRKLGRLVQIWRERYAYRQALARLDAHLLDDLGIKTWEAARECSKPFWRP